MQHIQTLPKITIYYLKNQQNLEERKCGCCISICSYKEGGDNNLITKIGNATLLNV